MSSILMIVLLTSYGVYKISKSKRKCFKKCDLKYDSSVCKDGQLGCAYAACVDNCNDICIKVPTVEDVVCF